jgi:hypothetical protein
MQRLTPTLALLALPFLFALSALPAQADAKKILMVVPNAVKRTAVNMVTFRHKESAILQWTSMAAAFADAETTRRSVARGSIEHNPILGSRPSGPRVYFTLLPIGFSYATMTQVIQDRVEKPRPFTWGLTGLAVVAHGYVAYHNTTICPAGTTCNFTAQQ